MCVLVSAFGKKKLFNFKTETVSGGLSGGSVKDFGIFFFLKEGENKPQPNKQASNEE